MAIFIPRTSLPAQPDLGSVAPSSAVEPVQDIGRPVYAIARGTAQVSRVAAEIYQHERDREVQSRVLELDIERREADRAVIDGYLSRSGKDAVENRDAALAAIAANSKAIRAKVKDRAVRDLWARQDAALSSSAVAQLDGHYRAQNVRSQADTLQSRAELLVSSVGRVAFGVGYDPASGRLSVEAERTRSAFRDSIAELGGLLGWAPERIEVEQRKADSTAFAGVVQGLVADERAGEAAQVLQAHGDRIDPQVLRGLQAHVRRAKVDEQSFALAQAVAGTGRPLLEQLAMIDGRVGKETPIEVLGNRVGTEPAISVDVADAARARVRQMHNDAIEERSRIGTEALKRAMDEAALQRVRSFDSLPLTVREGLEATGKASTFRLWLEEGNQFRTTQRGLRLLQEAEDPAWLRSRPLEVLRAAADADLSPRDQRALIADWHKANHLEPPSVDDSMVTRTLRRKMQERGWLPFDREAKPEEAARYNWVLEQVHRQLGPKAGPQERVDEVIDSLLRETLTVGGATRPLDWWTPEERKAGVYVTEHGDVPRTQVSPELVQRQLAENVERNKTRRDWNAAAPVSQQVEMLPTDTPGLVRQLAAAATSRRAARKAASDSALEWLRANRDQSDVFERMPDEMRKRLEKLDVLNAVRVDFEDWDRTHDFLGRRITPEGPISRSPWGR